MECTYIHIQPDINNIPLIQRMHMIMTVTPNRFTNQNVVGDLIDNRAYELIFVMDYNDIEIKLSMKNPLQNFFGAL